MRAGALSRAAVPAAERPAGPPTWRELALAWAACVTVVLGVAVIFLIVAPDWLSEDEIAVPRTVAFFVGVLLNNLLLALLPLIGGWAAAGQLLAGRRLRAGVFMGISSVIVLRQLLTVGAVGGADPHWLLDSSRWWLLEIGALAVAIRTALWLARNPGQRELHGPAAMRRGVGAVVAIMLVGAVIEVLTA